MVLLYQYIDIVKGIEQEVWIDLSFEEGEVCLEVLPFEYLSLPTLGEPTQKTSHHTGDHYRHDQLQGGPKK
ncbi:hypothetical protein GCM10028827_36750 [Mucilaginibacter myungsuensis]